MCQLWTFAQIFYLKENAKYLKNAIKLFYKFLVLYWINSQSKIVVKNVLELLFFLKLFIFMFFLKFNGIFTSGTRVAGPLFLAQIVARLAVSATNSAKTAYCAV